MVGGIFLLTRNGYELPRSITSFPGTQTVQEVNEAEIYTLVLELASKEEVSFNHTTRTGRVYQPPHLQGNDPQSTAWARERADVPEYDILEQLRKIPVPFANCSRHPRSTLTSSLVC